MGDPPSPSPSSTSSTLTDSESNESNESNDSGIDSASSSSASSSGCGKFPADYMDIDEFLTASGVCEHECEEMQIDKVNNSRKRNLMSGTVSHSPPVVVDSGQAGMLTSNKQHGARNGEFNSIKNNKNNKNKAGRKRQHEEYAYNPMPIGSKARRKFVPDKEKDGQYWTRRVKNNMAARRSRDMRRQKEIEIANKWKALERENARLKDELQQLKDRADELEKLLMQKQSH